MNLYGVLIFDISSNFVVIVGFIPTYLDDNGVSGYLQSTGDIHRATHQLQSASLLVGGDGVKGGRRREGEEWGRGEGGEWERGGRRGMGERKKGGGRRGKGEEGERIWGEGEGEERGKKGRGFLKKE